MKVLCVNTKDNPFVKVKEGQVYTAGIDGGELPHDEPVYYIIEVDQYIYQRRFVPLSNKDETDYADEVLTRMFQPIKF